MIDATWVGDAIRLLPMLYVGLFVVLLALAWFFPRRLLNKVVCVAIVIGVFALEHWSSVREAEQRQAERAQERAEYQARLDAATAIFEERCKGAGEKILRSVDSVERVVWMRWRPEKQNFSDQFALDDPYGRDCGGEACILKLLRVSKDANKYLEGARRHRGVYDFVETQDPRDDKKYRYTAAMKLVPGWTPKAIEEHRAKTGQPPPDFAHRPTLEREPIERFSAHYGITWDDISTREDREHWIAGGSLKVIDLQTNAVIAERIGFMMDRRLGNTDGARSPWGFAQQNACPPFQTIGPSDPRRTRGDEGRQFIQKTLKPSQGERQ